MPLTDKYQPKVHRDDPRFDEQQFELLKLQEQIFEKIFGPRRDPTVPIKAHESRNPTGVNPLFNPYFLKIRARGYDGDPALYWYVEVPHKWEKHIYHNPELPFKNLEYGETGDKYDPKKKYRNFVIKASFEKERMDVRDQEAISALGKCAMPQNRHGERLGTERRVPGIRSWHVVQTKEGQRTVYVSVLAVKPRVVPLSDVVEQIAAHPSLVEDLVRQIFEIRWRLSLFRPLGGKNFDQPLPAPFDQPWVGVPWKHLAPIGPSHPALPSGDLSRCCVRLPPGGIPKSTAATDYYGMKYLLHILAEVAPNSMNRNVVIEENTAFRFFMGNNIPATEFTQSDIRRLAMTFSLSYSFHNFSQILVRKGKRHDPASNSPCYDLIHLHGWSTACFEPVGLDVIRWDTLFPLHLPGYAAFYHSFRQISGIRHHKEEECPRLHDAAVRYMQAMYDLWTKTYKGMYEDEEKSRKEWLKKMKSAGWTYRGVEKGWRKVTVAGSVKGSLRRAFR